MSGKLLSAAAKVAIKWFLKVHMAHLAVLAQCSLGGTCWNLTSYFVFQILGAIYVKYVYVNWRTMKQQEFVGGLPGIANGCSLAVWERRCMNGICVVMVQEEYV